MSYLSKIKSNKLKQFIMLLQGDPGCGKSTMANQIPDTLYLGIESIGLVRDNLIDKNDIPNYNALLEILTEIRDDPEFAFKSIVLDSATAINRLMENYILDKYTINGNRPTSIIDENNRDLNFGKGEKMKISDIIQSGKPCLSFEVFPPKTWENVEKVKAACSAIAELKPDYMSVTYGAGGGTRQYTADIASFLLEKGVTPLAHLSCVFSDREGRRL